MREIEFFFDVSSPWTYLAFHNIQPLAQEAGARIRWRPFMVGGVFNTINPSVYASREHPIAPKQHYLRKSIADWARLSGLRVRFPPSIFPINSVKVMRGCLVAEAQGQLVPFARAAFEAYWAEDQDIASDAVLRALCARCQLDADALLAAIAQPAIKDALRANTDELIARGGFGSPTFFVNGGDMYFGNDHLPLVRMALGLEKQR